MSALSALAGIQLLYGVVHKVKDNKEELLSLTSRLEHILQSLEESYRRDIIRGDDYTNALTVISDLILRTQRVSQRLLKRSLGDRTWNSTEISGEIKRLNADVSNYLSVHTIRTLDIIQGSHSEQFRTLSDNVEDIMVKIAELDLHLRPRPGDHWDEGIQRQARENSNQPQSSLMAQQNTLDDIQLYALATSAKTSIQITGLQRYFRVSIMDPVTFSNLKIDAGIQDILKVIKDEGYLLPEKLHEAEDLAISVTKETSVYDTTAPGGLQISSTEPLLWWWNKYLEYHGIAPNTTPGQTIAEIGDDDQSITTGGVTFRCHRTLRVPDGDKNYNLPPDIGCFPLIPVAKYAHRLPQHMNEKGGFIMPMFKREALWISFHGKEGFGVPGSAVKISAGGVNVISGVHNKSISPPHIVQDYVVAGLQPWIDGIVTMPGVIRQFVCTELGKGYTIEEQVTDKMEVGGLQFDIFPHRQSVQGHFTLQPTQARLPSTLLNCEMTPEELNITDGQTICLHRADAICVYHEPWTRNPQQPKLHTAAIHENQKYEKEWTLSSHRHRSSHAGLYADYGCQDIDVRARARLSDVRLGSPKKNLTQDLLGISAGGKIEQNIYKDHQSPRVYDEQHSHRFYIHIVSPETWEIITGVLPPITPITRDMYKQHNIPWFTLYDNYIPHLDTVSTTLAKVKSVAQLDQQEYGSDSESPSSELVDPNHPGRCPRHPRLVPSCVFRPCGHLGCDTCLGATLLANSKCVECGDAVAMFVGVDRPIPQVTKAGVGGGSQHGTTEDQAAWNIHEIEELATIATKSKRVTVIHMLEDRVSPLHSTFKLSNTRF